MQTPFLNPLKQARKNADMSLQDMAFLIDVDVSNLSKYERGIKSAPVHVCLAYYVITKSSLAKLFSQHMSGVIELVSTRLTNLIEMLEEEATSPKVKRRIESLYESLNNISCLKDVSGKNDE